MTDVKQMNLVYVGKYPAHGDFVRSAMQPTVVQFFDKIMADAMSQLSVDKSWEAHYDQMSPIHFLYCSMGKQTQLIGTVSPSRDMAGRRYPLTSGTVVDTALPINLSLLSAELIWLQCHILNSKVVAASTDYDAQRVLENPLLDVKQKDSSDYFQFLNNTYLYDLQQLQSSTISVSQSLLALGLLLRPACTAGIAGLDKALLINLGIQDKQTTLIACFWLDIIKSFIQNHHVDLATYFTQKEGQCILVVCFQGASAAVLSDLLAGDMVNVNWVNVFQSGWIKPMIESDAGLQKLEHLVDDSISTLFDTLSLIREAFIG